VYQYGKSPSSHARIQTSNSKCLEGLFAEMKNYKTNTIRRRGG